MQKWTFFLTTVVVLLMILKPQETEARMTVQGLRNALKGFARKCLASTGVDPEIAANTRKGEFPPDPALQCYIMCVFNQMKIIKDGRIRLELINKQVEAVIVHDVIGPAEAASATCDVLANSTDTCEQSWQFNKCLYETDPTIYFFP